MRKIYLPLLAIVFIQFSGFAQQWLGDVTSTGTIWRTGGVTIGSTTSPTDLFELHGSHPYFTIKEVSHDTSNNSYRAGIKFTDNLNNSAASIGFLSSSNNDFYFVNNIESARIRFKIGTSYPMYLLKNKVGIGVDPATVSENYSLIVAGTTKTDNIVTDTVYSKEILIKDYDYTLDNNSFYSSLKFIDSDNQALGLFGYLSSSNNDLYVINKNDAGKIRFKINDNYPMYITKENVGIGIDPTTITNNPYALAVNGIIGAKEIIVETESFPDYVFNKDYKLLSLNEVDEFISKNKHLPGIPPASEVEVKGINVGEMETKLLEKIEELTLYIINQEKRISRLEEQNMNLLNK